MTAVDRLRSAADARMSLAGGATAAHNFILLHEVAHYLQVPGLIADDGRNVERQKFNNDTLWQHCE
jgi:hypothetical protein